ncbi:MAG: hypothetical protein IJJ45_03460 [Clostridia bacterium]|nr:hypothetical protein [Clostridia bacterium]
MKIYDFDGKFFDYVRSWMALHPGMKESEIEASYNEMMRSWLNAPAQWLGGVKPGEYFDRYTDPKDLIKLLEAYLVRDIGLPEPLYRRIVLMGEACAPALVRIAEDRDRPEALRATAMALLRDIDSDVPMSLYIDLICRCKEKNELSDMAADAISERQDVVETLLERYDSATEYGQLLILDICSNHPGDPRICDHMLEKLRNRPEERALYAALLGKLGDPRALETLMRMLDLTDLSYLDYIELRSAVEQLGGDPGEERVFNGDPDYETLRGL